METEFKFPTKCCELNFNGCNEPRPAVIIRYYFFKWAFSYFANLLLLISCFLSSE